MMRWWGWILFLLAAATHAAPVEIVLPGGLTGMAEYRQGEVGKPTILLLHGFLQTHEFATIHRLAEGLAGEGYSVLTPTLTLGATHRRQSLPCEAIHTHTMPGISNEIAAWVNWLKAKKPRSIVLMGHSLGSVNTLAYLSARRDPAIRKYIGVSIMEGSWKAGDLDRDHLMRTLRAKVKSGDRQLVTYAFSFCQKFQATPETMLSYLEWTPDRILEAANRIAIPGTFIMGGRDERLGPDWIKRLRTTRAKVRVIDGANHFMDGEYEFDLLDNVIAELR